MNLLPIEDRVFEHVVGDQCPLDDLFKRGTVSPSWVEKYLELVVETKRVWVHEPTWPRQLVAAVHISTRILDSRYRAWVGADKNRRNLETEDMLGQVGSANNIFLDEPVLERCRIKGYLGPDQNTCGF